MEMNVVHRLSSIRAVVGDHPITRFEQSLLPGDCDSQCERVRNDVCVVRDSILQRRQMLSWNHQHMGRSLWRKVTERDIVRALGHERGSQFATRDAAENAVVGHSRPRGSLQVAW